ncbi:MAG: Fis family transcriptional regulator [Casimicrobiaceae bacterium]|nr:Fis family transcriptional regulator [Casimicrobiaceae bacterium]MDW8311215.1 helix-turn-helix domain-containing protein [Burkholderiales bacterium]
MNKSKEFGHAVIAACVTASLDAYLKHLDGERVSNLHELVMSTVEKTLIEDVLARAGHNQSKAAAMLGINRNTLRSKLEKYRIKLG